MKYIVHVCDRFTARVFKCAFVEQQAGNMVQVLYRDPCHLDLLSLIMSSSCWHQAGALNSKLDVADANDAIVHVHTSHDNADLVDQVKAGFSGPVVWNIHDWPTHVDWPVVEGYVVPSIGMHDQVVVRLEGAPSKPCRVVYSKVPNALCSVSPGEGEYVKNSVVLNSGVVATDKPAYRDYREIEKKLKELRNWRLFIYPCWHDASLSLVYDHVFRTVPYLHLLQRIRSFEWAWTGAGNSRCSIDTCVTNKFWEALSQGVPVITWRSSEMRSLHAGKYGEDWSWLDLSQCSSPAGDVRRRNVAYRKNIAAAGDELSMESELPKLMEVYEEVTNA